MGIDIKGVDVANKAVSVLNREYQPIVLKGASVLGDCRSCDDPPSKDRLIERRKRTEFLEKSVQFDSYEGTKDGGDFTDFWLE